MIVPAYNQHIIQHPRPIFDMKVIRAVRFFGLTSLKALLSGCALSALATDHPVTTSGLTFSPPTLTIPAGDSVTWSGLQGGGHTTTSDTSLWNSGPDGFKFVFNTSGTFHYHCIPHQGFGMVGTITVNAAPNVPPTISVTNPASGKVFAAPANVTVQTSPADSDGSVTNVQFLVGPTVLGNKSGQPFSMTASNLAAADYVMSAIVSDNKGAKATNSVTIHVIDPSPVVVRHDGIARQFSVQLLGRCRSGICRGVVCGPVYVDAHCHEFARYN